MVSVCQTLRSVLGTQPRTSHTVGDLTELRISRGCRRLGWQRLGRGSLHCFLWGGGGGEQELGRQRGRAVGAAETVCEQVREHTQPGAFGGGSQSPAEVNDREQVWGMRVRRLKRKTGLSQREPFLTNLGSLSIFHVQSTGLGPEHKKS